MVLLEVTTTTDGGYRAVTITLEVDTLSSPLEPPALFSRSLNDVAGDDEYSRDFEKGRIEAGWLMEGDDPCVSNTSISFSDSTESDILVSSEFVRARFAFAVEGLATRFWVVSIGRFPATIFRARPSTSC